MKCQPFAIAVTLSAALLTTTTTFSQSAKPLPKKSVASKPAPSRSVPSASQGGSGVVLKSQNDSLSYSIGVSIAQSIKQQGIANVNTAVLTRAIGDALNGGTPKLSIEQCQQIVQNYFQKQSAGKMAETQKISMANKTIGDAFLADNKAKPGVQTTASGLQYLIEKEGTGPKPASTDKVKVHYTGKLIDGKVFDSSVERGQPIEFPVTGVIPGWVEALQLMPVGSKWKLFIPANLAYGDRGAGADIAPGSTLLFDVELLEIVK